MNSNEFFKLKNELFIIMSINWMIFFFKVGKTSSKNNKRISKEKMFEILLWFLSILFYLSIFDAFFHIFNRFNHFHFLSLYVANYNYFMFDNI